MTEVVDSLLTTRAVGSKLMAGGDAAEVAFLRASKELAAFETDSSDGEFGQLYNSMILTHDSSSKGASNEGGRPAIAAAEEMEGSMLVWISSNISSHEAMALFKSWLGTSTSSDRRSCGSDDRGEAVNLRPLLGPKGGDIHSAVAADVFGGGAGGAGK